MLQFQSKCIHLFLFLAGSFLKREAHYIILKTTRKTNLTKNDNHDVDKTSLCHFESGESRQYSTFCERISSYDAALLIKNAYGGHNVLTNNMKNLSNNTLLIITSDASRGANRFSGLATILREIPCIHYEKNRKVTHYDRVIIATRRMHSKNARDISKLEVAAVAMGIRTAIKYIPPDRRRNVLILTDSNSALDFYCRNNDVSLDKRSITSSLSLLNDPHYKAMQMMLQENVDPEREGATGRRIQMAKVKSNKFENDGFFDHDATDIISSVIKTKSNKQASEIYSWGDDDDGFIVTSCNRDSYERKIMDIDFNTRSLLVPCLRSQDIDFLASSESKVEMKQKKPQVVVKRERGERLERSKQRIQEEFVISTF